MTILRANNALFFGDPLIILENVSQGFKCLNFSKELLVYFSKPRRNIDFQSMIFDIDGLLIYIRQLEFKLVRGHQKKVHY